MDWPRYGPVQRNGKFLRSSKMSYVQPNMNLNRTIKKSPKLNKKLNKKALTKI